MIMNDSSNISLSHFLLVKQWSVYSLFCVCFNRIAIWLFKSWLPGHFSVCVPSCFIHLAVNGTWKLAGHLGRNMYAAIREAAAAISIQKFGRRWLARHSYLQLKASIVLLQASIRGFSARQRYLHQKEHRAAILIQVILFCGLSNLGFIFVVRTISSQFNLPPWTEAQSIPRK